MYSAVYCHQLERLDFKGSGGQFITSHHKDESFFTLVLHELTGREIAGFDMWTGVDLLLSTHLSWTTFVWESSPDGDGEVTMNACVKTIWWDSYLVRLQIFLFHFPFDEIHRRLLSFTLGRSVSAWIDYSTTKWNRQTRQHQGKRPTWSPVY